MNISGLPVSGSNPVPENPKQFVVTIGVVVTAESELAAADRVADLGRRLTEDCEVLDWTLHCLEPLSEKGGMR
jgi:hypothetical protein